MTNALLERIDQRLAALKLTDQAACKRAIIDKDTIRDLRRGKRSTINGDTLRKLSLALETTPSWLLGQHLDSEEVLPNEDAADDAGFSRATTFTGKLPGSSVEIDAGAGAGRGFVGDGRVVVLDHDGTTVGHRVVNEWVFASDFLHEIGIGPKGILLLKVIGDSMSPTLAHGDRIMIDFNYTIPHPEGLYVIDEGHGPQVKRVEIVKKSKPMQLKIISDNPLHDTRLVDAEDVRIVGRVAAKISRT